MAQCLTGDEALRKVESQAREMATVENEAERGYAHLGWLLLEVAQMQYWRVRYNTFHDYLKVVSLHAKKTPSQLQRYLLTVRDLSDTFSSAQMESMGITKAMRLCQAKDYAIVLPAVVVNAALDPKVTVKELKGIIAVTLKLPAEDDGDWMEFEFLVSQEDRALIQQAMDVARHTEPLTKVNISESAQMKDIVVKWCMEFLGSHSGDGL